MHAEVQVRKKALPSRIQDYRKTVYLKYDIERLLWPNNSPNLDVIEPAWQYLKWRTTARGAPEARALVEQQIR